jgi:hypothetical protein
VACVHGRLTARFPFASNVRLEDLDGDLVVTASRGTVRRFGDGKTTTFGAGGTARAQLEPAGLFVAGTRRVTFTPIGKLLQRLGS